MRMQCALILMVALCANASLALKGMEIQTVRVSLHTTLGGDISAKCSASFLYTDVHLSKLYIFVYT